MPTPGLSKQGPHCMRIPRSSLRRLTGEARNSLHGAAPANEGQTATDAARMHLIVHPWTPRMPTVAATPPQSGQKRPQIRYRDVRIAHGRASSPAPSMNYRLVRIGPWLHKSAPSPPHLLQRSTLVSNRTPYE